jgi:hypothetical protein
MPRVVEVSESSPTGTALWAKVEVAEIDESQFGCFQEINFNGLDDAHTPRSVDSITSPPKSYGTSRGRATFPCSIGTT